MPMYVLQHKLYGILWNDCLGTVISLILMVRNTVHGIYVLTVQDGYNSDACTRGIHYSCLSQRDHLGH